MTAAGQAPILEIVDFGKTYRVRRSSGLGRCETVAAQHISFTVGDGESVAIIGESGSGKSTIARCIVGLETATAGTIRFRGEDWTSRRRLTHRERRRRGGEVQMVFQDPYQSLDPRQRIGAGLDEVLRLHTPLAAAERRDRIDELLTQVRLPPATAASLPRPLSGGQRQRVAIARALAAQPRLLILDEAVSALDVSVQAQVLRLLADIRADTGVAFLFISHDLAVVRQISERVLVMRHGEIVETGDTDAVLRDPQHAYTKRLIASVPREGWSPRRAVVGID